MATKKPLTPEKKVSSGLIDLTKTGPLSYRELQNLNNNLPEETLANQLSMSTPGIYNALSRAGQVNYIQLPSDFGSSMFDQDLIGQNEFENYQEYRAERLPWYAQIGAGLAKGAILAGTTFLDGTVGLVLGAAQGFKNLADDDPNSGFLSGLWDNDFSRAMKSVSEWSEKELPNYYTEEEQNGSWFDRVFNANFLGDKFIKNLGFSVGAIYSGGAWSKALKLTHLPEIIGAVTRSSKAPAIVTSATGATISAVNEGRVEALNNSTEWFNSLKQQLDNIYLQRLADIAETYGVDNPYSIALAKKEELNYNLTIAKLTEDRVKMGNADLLMNIPILMASNLVLFGKMYANGFKTSRRTNNIIGKAGEYATGSSKLKGALAVTKGALSEGVEEISQSAASRAAANYYTTDVNNFYKAKTDPNAALETLDWTKAFTKGINETVNDSSAWEEFFIGTLTGALGIPKFKGMTDAQGNRLFPIGIEGGALNEWREYNEQMTRENEIATYMNNRVNSPEFKNYYLGLIRHQKYQNDMNQAVADNNEFEFKNAEYAQFISDISMFDNAGKLSDLTTLIDSAYDTSDANLLSIIENTTSTTEDGKKVGPFIDANGNPMTATEKGKSEMISKLLDTKDSMKKLIDEYLLIKNDLDILTGQLLTDDLLEELTWIKGQLNNWKERSNSLTEEIKPQLNKLVSELTSERDLFAQLKLREGASNTGITDAYELFSKKHKSASDALNTVELLIHSPNLSYVLANSPELVAGLKLALANTSTVTADEVLDFTLKIDDIVKLDKAQKSYSDKLKEYLENPEKQVVDHLKANEEAVKQEEKKQTDDLKTRLSSATNLNELRTLLDNESDAELKSRTLDDLESSGNELVKNYKETELYNKDVLREINALEVDPLTKLDALKLINDLYNNSSNLEEFANLNSPYIDNENAFDEDSLGDAELSAARFLNALYAAQTAMSKINNDNRFKDRFSPAFKRPIERPEKADPSKGTEKDDTGDSKTGTIPSVNSNKTLPDTYIPPTGNITADMVAEENKAYNDIAETIQSLDSKQAGTRPYYRPAIPQLHIESSKQGDFRPFNEIVKEREPNVNFDGIYEYLATNGAFTYVNDGNLKVGDEIGFMIDPKFSDTTIFMIDTRNNQIVGSLDESLYSVARYEGLSSLEEKIKAEYNQRENKESRFISTYKTRVAQVMTGKIPYSFEEKSLADIPNVKEEGRVPIFGIIRNGTLQTNGQLDDSRVVKPIDMSLKEGRMYLLIPNAAGKYSSAAVRVKHFNKTEFNLDDITINNTPVAKHLLLDIAKLAESTNEDDLKQAVKDLSNDLYTGELHIDWISTDKGNGITFKKATRDAEGNEIYDIRDGKRVRREISKTVFLTEKWDSNTVYSIGEDNQISTTPESKDINAISKEITDILLSFNLPLQVSIGMMNKGGYNNMLINSNILTSNISNAKVVGSWFTTDYFDTEGNLLSATSPASVTPLPRRKVETPVGGKEGAITGTKISIQGFKPYYVDLSNNTIRDEQGKLVKFDANNSQLYFDMAYAQDNYGDSTLSSMMVDNKVLLPSGRVLDRTTGKYITGQAALDVKDTILGTNDGIKEKRAKADKIVSLIYENQKKVDKTRTDGLYYYIMEDDGKYHEYSRVHSVLGSNWKESPAQTKALLDLRVGLSKAVDDNRFNNYLRWVENHYKMAPNTLGMYNDKTDTKSRDMIISIVRDHMSGTSSVRALNAGTSVDTVIRLYFTMKDVSKIAKPANMTEGAFIDLITKLLEVKSNIENSGETFLADNIVLFQAYPDGRRIAGEVDILAKTSDGRFKIYDVKTSKYSFYDFVDRYGHKVNYFKLPSGTQIMTTEAYYTMQLSGYKNLFESLYSYPISGLAIMPFVLSYEKDQVTQVVGEKGIPIKYNPNVNIPIQGSVLKVTEEAKKDDNSITVDGVTVSIIKTPNLTKGFGKDVEHAASYNYSVLFANGQTIEVIKNAGVDTSDKEAADKIKKALGGNLKRLHEVDSIPNPNAKVEKATPATILEGNNLTGAAKTITKELAANNSDDEFETEFTLRQTTDDKIPVWNLEKELKWLDDVLPQLSKEDRVKIVNGLIKVAENGPKAWGLFDRGIVKLSDIAAEGTAYHEAFHVVFNLLLDSNEREALFAEARQKWGADRKNNRLEELMAEDFREYVMSLEDRTLGLRIKDFFKNLFAKVTNWKFVKPSLNNYYRMINLGKYANMTLGQSQVVKNREAEFNEDGTVKPLATEALITDWSILDSEDKSELVKKGWTEDKFNSISQLERNQAIKCVGF